MPKVTPVEIHGDLSDDSELASEFETENETAVALAEPEPVDFTELENFFAAYGANRLASPASWAIAVGIDSSLLHNALRDGELSQVSRPSAADSHRRESGLKAADFLTWVKTSGIPFVLTEIARTSLTTPVAEAIEARALWSLDSAVRDLAADCGALRAAIVRGELRNCSDPNSCATVSCIEPTSLVRWLESRGEPVRLSLEYAAFLTRQRQHASSVEQSSPSVIDESLDLLASELAADEADATANLRAMRRHYTEILRRRAQPSPGDASDLAELAKQLGIGRAEMERDVAVLEAADALAAQVESIERSVTELNAAGAAKVALEKRHKVEEREALVRLRNAQTAHAIAVRAPSELAALRSSRPDLFGQ